MLIRHAIVTNVHSSHVESRQPDLEVTAINHNYVHPANIPVWIRVLGGLQDERV